MRSWWCVTALALAACASSAAGGRAGTTDGSSDDAVAEFEVRLVTSAYAASASERPRLHRIASQLCHGRYELERRRVERTLVAVPTYVRGSRTFVPAPAWRWELVAAIRCVEGTR